MDSSVSTLASGLAALASGGLAGLVAIPHCAAMCGPYAAFACGSADRVGAVGAPRAVSRFLSARIAAYATVGGLAGAAGSVARVALAPRWASIVLSCTLAVGMMVLAIRLARARDVRHKPDVSLADVVRGRRPADRSLALSSARSPMWFSLARARLVVSSRLASRAVGAPAMLGAVTVLFPCGALHAALLLAASTASPLLGAVVMVAFAAASSPSLALSGLVARAATTLDRPTRLGLSSALVVGAVILAVRPFVSDGANDAPACHGAATEPLSVSP